MAFATMAYDDPSCHYRRKVFQHGVAMSLLHARSTSYRNRLGFRSPNTPRTRTCNIYAVRNAGTYAATSPRQLVRGIQDRKLAHVALLLRSALLTRDHISTSRLETGEPVRIICCNYDNECHNGLARYRLRQGAHISKTHQGGERLRVVRAPNTKEPITMKAAMLELRYRTFATYLLDVSPVSAVAGKPHAGWRRSCRTRRLPTHRQR